MAENQINVERRKLLKSVGVATPVATLGRSEYFDLSDADREKVGKSNFVQASISYEPREVYPVIHWDGFPKFTVTDDDKLEFFLIESNDLDNFRTSDTVVAYEDITEQHHYERLSEPTVVPKNEVGEITTGIDSSVRAHTHPELPAIFDSDGDAVTVRTGNRRTTVASDQEKTIRLTDRKITAVEKGKKKKDTATPILTVKNHGSVEVYGPPQEVLDKLN